jgi:hypothetical protein
VVCVDVFAPSVVAGINAAASSRLFALSRNNEDNVGITEEEFTHLLRSQRTIPGNAGHLLSIIFVSRLTVSLIFNARVLFKNK